MEAMMRFATAQGPRLLALGVGATALQTLQALSCDAAAAAGAARQLCDLRALLDSSVRLDSSLGALLLGAALALAVLVHLAARAYRAAAVYVVDFSVFAPPNGWQFSHEDLRRCAMAHGGIAAEDIELIMKLVYRSGLGNSTAIPPGPVAWVMQEDKVQRGDKPGIEMAREEYEAACFPTIQALLDKTGVPASQIKFVITNSSLFNPTPSLSAAVINRFGLKDDTINYNLGGMGCSAGVVALDLARSLLREHPGSYALVVSHENVTNSYYCGRDKSMLVPNALFRSNGAAVLLSSRPADAGRSKYTLRHIVRTIMAADDEAYRCVWQTDDDELQQGVRLKKELIGVAGRTVKRNMGRLGPLVLPVSEQLKFAANAAVRAGLKALPPKTAASLPVPASWRKPYTPNFSKAFDAVCIHTGGRGVIDSMEQNLGMSKDMVEASRAALFAFGNTSSCSVWYELAYKEAFGGLPRGARVWQIAFGSGFKCNSAVLRANRAVKDAHSAWEGFDKAKMYAQLEDIEREVAASRARRAAEKAAAAAAEAVAAAASR